MHPPRIELLALVAIGLASGASAAHAQFANVFVPEPGCWTRCAPEVQEFRGCASLRSVRIKSRGKMKSAPSWRLRQAAMSEVWLPNVLLVH
jgi:hypothetical protein